MIFPRLQHLLGDRFNRKVLPRVATLLGLVLVFYTIISYLSARDHRIGQRREAKAFQDYAVSRLAEPVEVVNFREFAHRLRLYGELLDQHEQDNPKVSLRIAAQASAVEAAETLPYPSSPILWILEQQLFPWAHRKYSSILELKHSFSGRGIVIPTGAGLFNFAIHLIRQIRFHRCKLPILIAVAEETELTPAHYGFLAQMEVGVLDISKILSTDEEKLRGWQVKPFAILAAPFEEVITLDADVVLLQNPETMLHDQGYKDSGAIFFPDRTLFSGDHGKRQWIDANVPSPLPAFVTESRMYTATSAHEQESCAVVINKRMRLLGLLAATKMNARQERDLVTYKKFYGDKESFWIGMAMAKQNFTRLSERPGVIGEGFGEPNQVEATKACGRILQFDRQGRPLLLNGSIIRNRHETGTLNARMSFTHTGREGVWEFPAECLQHEVRPLSEPNLELLDALWELYEYPIDLDKPPRSLPS